MNRVNQPTAPVTGGPISVPSVMSTPSHREPLRTFFTGILVAAGLAAAVTAPAWADTVGAADPESVAREHWRAVMMQNLPQEAGCFRESYPNLVHEKVACHAGPSPVHPMRRRAADEVPFEVGNRDDHVAETKGKTFWAGGSFLDVSVHSEASVGVAATGYAGSLGPNEYSLQVNTNNNRRTTNGCNGGNSDCHVWQQFVYSTDKGVFIQYWLLNYGKCPNSKWNQSGQNCFINGGNVAEAPNFTIGDLARLSLHAAAQAGGLDCAVLYDDTGAGWGACEPDSQLDISSVWDQTEFGIFGNGGDSEAQFSFGTSFATLLQVNDGSGTAPTCLSDAGTTGESTNLTLGKCEPLTGNGLYPRIRFTESNKFSTPNAPNLSGEILSGQGLTPGHSWHSFDKRFTLTMQTDGNLVLYEGKVALWNTGTVGQDVAFMIMQADGNLVLYNTKEVAVWASNTPGYEDTGAYLNIQDDGNLVIYPGPNPAIWASNTAGH